MCFAGISLAAPATGPQTSAEREEFLRTAKIVKTRPAGSGITGVIRATLEKDGFTHDCSIQTIEEYKTRFEGSRGVEMNFKDSWKFNVAGYKLDRLLGMNMTPVTVERRYVGKTGSFCWWIDDVLMDEKQRKERKVEPPNQDEWAEQMYMVRVFDQLVYNTDRNLGNLIIDKSWKMWMIDESRAFRILPSLPEPKDLVKCDEALLQKLKELDEAVLKRELGSYLTNMEMKGLLQRRDKIVQIFEQKGPSALYTSPRRPS